ncbi:MAG: biopolymer transporter ExbD [bacterium]
MIKSPDQETIGWYVHGFRRYRPANHLNRGLVSSAPWVNFALLVAMYLYFLAPNVLQPGVAVQLPEAPFTDGRHYGHNLVVLSLPVAGRPEREEIVFFDDDRYLERDGGQMDALRVALAKARREKAGLPLVVEADQAVRHATIVRVFDMASEAGFREVNLATRPTER